VFASSGTGLLKWTFGGTVRQAPAEVINTVEFEPFGTSPYYRMVVDFTMHEPLWQAESARTAGPTEITTSPQNITLVNNGTYRNEWGTITVEGQIVDPTFTIGSDWVKYTGTVSNGGTLTLDMANWTATNGTADVSGDISHEGDLVWLPIPIGTAVTLTVSGTSIASSPNVTVSYVERFV